MHASTLLEFHLNFFSNTKISILHALLFRYYIKRSFYISKHQIPVFVMQKSRVGSYHIWHTGLNSFCLQKHILRYLFVWKMFCGLVMYRMLVSKLHFVQEDKKRNTLQTNQTTQLFAYGQVSLVKFSFLDYRDCGLGKICQKSC